KPMDVARLVEMVGEATLKPPILVVDDDPDFCRTMTRMLEMKGYRVYAAGSGGEALRVAREVVCPIAFIDVRMPEMDGIETYLALKEINPELVPIMMTGYREEMCQIIEKYTEAPAATCLYKPFNPSQVMQLVSQFAD
ncbi:MAG: response regulator, partial [Chloroflexota bacterium]